MTPRRGAWRLPPGVRRLFRLPKTRERLVHDMEEELRFHGEAFVSELRASGMTEEEARAEAAMQFGDFASFYAHIERRAVRNARRFALTDWFEDWGQDVRFALRQLRRSPSWTAVALLTIALGVGASTAVFSVANTLLLRTLPYPNASRVFMAQRQFTVQNTVVPAGLPFGIARVWRENARTIEAAVKVGHGPSGSLVVGTDSIPLRLASIEPGFVAFAGAHLIVGHVPRAEEVTENSHLLVLSEALWRERFGGSPDVVGRAVRFHGDGSIGDHTETVVGVATASLTVPDFRAEPTNGFHLAAVAEWTPGPVLVRLKEEVSRQAATAELQAITDHSNLAEVRPVPGPLPLRLTRPQDWLPIRQQLSMLTAAVILLLLVACTNVSHLLLARGAARQRELAIRNAIGASRWRLVRQLTTESLVIAAFGGALAIFVGWAALHGMLALRPDDQNLRVLSWVSTTRGIAPLGAAIAIATGLAVGVVSAFRGASHGLALELRVGAASTIKGARRLRSTLVVGEISLSAVLLIAAVLLIHSILDLERANLGFDARGLYAVMLRPPPGTPLMDRRAFADAVRDRIARMPGVSDAVIVSEVPGGRAFTLFSRWETPGHPYQPADSAAGQGTRMAPASPEYFRVFRIPLIAGRMLDNGSFAKHEVIVSRSLANYLAPGQNPLGLRFRNANIRGSGIIVPGQQPRPVSDNPWQTIIGVVPDVVSNLVADSPNAALYPAEDPSDSAVNKGLAVVTVAVRIEDERHAARLAGLARELQPKGPVPTVANVRDKLNEALVEPLFTMRILVIFAVLGVVLAGVGIFGLISYTVSQRTNEIGIRITLGASRESIAKLVLGDGLRLAAIGVVLGLISAVAATRIIQSMLHGLSRLDPLSYSIGAAVLLAVAAVACLGPLLRATSVDPVAAIRAE